MQFPTHKELVSYLDAFLARHPTLAETAMGRALNNEPGLIASIRAGRQPSLKMCNKLADFMRERDSTAGGGDHDASDTTPEMGRSPGKSGDVTAQAVPA